MLRIMEINGKIKLKYNNLKDAKIVFDTLKIDNDGFIESKIDSNEISYSITSKTLGSFLNTIDDLIASEIVAEKIITSTNDN